MMSTQTVHRFISQLTESETIDDVYLVSEKNMRANRNGNLYLQMRLADRTGNLLAMLWNANEKISNAFEAGDYVRVQGATQFYNGNLQMIANHIKPVDKSTIDESDYIILNANKLEELNRRLTELLRSIKSVPLLNLAECFLVDECMMKKLSEAPAGIKNHHAYNGGLLQHIVDLMELCELVVQRYPIVDRDMLLMGVLLHDIGKVDELAYVRELAYTSEGQLVGHITIGITILDRKIAEAEQLSGEEFPKQIAIQLKHMILSHNGSYEFGSPKLPMTPEAMTLHLLDTLDARLHALQQLLQSDVSDDPDWTNYIPSLGRKFYKPTPGNAT